MWSGVRLFGSSALRLMQVFNPLILFRVLAVDFSFYITFTRDTGMKFFDIKYRGETVVYELGLQEAIAHYAGNDPVQSGTAYLDTYYGFG